MSTTDGFSELPAITTWEATRRGVLLHAGQERIRFEFLKPDLVRVKISQGGVFESCPTFAVIADEFGTPYFRVDKVRNGLRMCSDVLKITIRFAPFHFDISRLADGSPVLRSRRGQAYRHLNDTWRVQRLKQKTDTILGLGEKTQPFDHNGKTLTMWNTDILAPAVDGSVRRSDGVDPLLDPRSDRFDPYYISINLHYHLPSNNPACAAASYIDCGYRLQYDFSPAQHYEIGGEGGQLTEYIFAGPSIDYILNQFTELTGRIQRPPLWALGHHQCRWHNYAEKDLLKLAETYRRKQIPCDSLWLDIDYMDGFRVFTWNRERFPDPEALLAELRRQGLRVVTIIDPGVKAEPGYSVFDEAQEKNLLCKTESGKVYIGSVWPGRTAFPDFTKETARQWWGRLNATHVASGLAGIWNDMNEPATGKIPPSAMRFDRDGANHPHGRYRNQYALLMAMGTVMGLRKAMPELRTFVLSRAGFAGIQRYAANWTGDNFALWEHLQMSLPMNANLGLSGQPFVGSDIGGFVGQSNGELLLRWYQYGVFQPFMRNHTCAGSPEHYPWSFGPEIETHIRAAIELRYRLLPYIYSAFVESSETGAPIQRPLVYNWQEDPQTVRNSTEFLFGNHLLVAPVLTAGAAHRSLYLPKGDWLDFYTGDRFHGGRQLEVEAPLAALPLFVRAGAVIPMCDVALSTDGFYPENIDLHVFVPAQDGVTHSVLYEDDGMTDGYRRGEFVKTTFTLERQGTKVILDADVSGNGFAAQRRRSLTLHFHGTESAPHTMVNSGSPFQHSFTVA